METKRFCVVRFGPPRLACSEEPGEASLGRRGERFVDGRRRALEPYTMSNSPIWVSLAVNIHMPIYAKACFVFDVGTRSTTVSPWR